jgi:hypothetical protein
MQSVFRLIFEASKISVFASLLRFSGVGARSSRQFMGTKLTTMSSDFPKYCDEEVMSQKGHGTCASPVMENLRWGCDWNVADRICCYNRHYAEHSGYWLKTSFLKEVRVSISVVFLL